MHLDPQFAGRSQYIGVQHIGVFHHQHRVGAPWNHAAGRKNRGRPLGHRFGGFHPRRQHLRVQSQQTRAIVGGPGRVGCAHGKAVHIRAVEARHVHAGDNLARQHAPQRLRQPNPLLAQRRHPQMRTEALFRLVPANHF
jgi:hypothetical protein